MIPTVIDTSEIVGDFQAEEMTLHLTPQLFRMISTSIYECRERAIVQELVANSLDACIEKGTTAPIEITLPTAAAPQLTVLDHGIGMDADTLMNSALAYGNSTKALDNISVGGFGIGLKSVFSITDSVTITTVKDGMKHVALGMMVDGIPVHKLVRSEPTEESSGTAVVIPAPAEYFGPLSEIAHSSFTHWTHDVIVDGKKVNTTPLALSKDSPLYVQLHSGWSDRVRVCVGGFMLEVSQSMAGLDLSKLRHWTGRGSVIDLVIYADIGELEIAPSRERIEYTQANRDILQDRIDEYAALWATGLEHARMRILAHYSEHYELYNKEHTLEDYPAIAEVGQRLRQICDKGTLELCCNSLRERHRRYTRELVRKLLDTYDITDFDKSYMSSNHLLQTMVRNVFQTSLENTEAASIRLRGSRYATTSSSILNIILEDIKAQLECTQTTYTFVVTDMARSRFSRMLNHADVAYVPLNTSRSPNGRNIGVTRLILIDEVTQEKIKVIQKRLSNFSKIDFDFVDDSYFQDLWDEAVKESRKSRATAPSTSRTPAARADVQARAVILSTGSTPETQMYRFRSEPVDLGFYHTIEKFDAICPETGRKRLLIIGTADAVGATDNDGYSTLQVPSMHGLLRGSDIHTQIADVVILIAPSVSQVRSMRTTRLIAELPQDQVFIAEYPAEARRWVSRFTSEAHTLMMWGLHIILRKGVVDRPMSDIVRQLPYKAMRQTFLKLPLELQNWYLESATLFVDHWTENNRDMPTFFQAMSQVNNNIGSRWSRTMRLARDMEDYLQELHALPNFKTLTPLGLKPEAVLREIRMKLRILIEEAQTNIARREDTK